MNKTIKTILAVIAVLAVILLAALAQGKKPVKEISMDKYDKIVEKGGYVYYGENKEALEKLSEKLNDTINVLNPKDANLDNLKEGTLYLYEEGKEVYKYTGDVSSYKFIETLMKDEIIEKTYLTITFDEYKEIFKSKGYNFMFIGSETCSWCSKFKETINEVLKDYDFNVYYIDLSTLTQDEYTALVETDSYMSENEWGTPLNILYKDGKRINVINGYVPANELITFLKDNKVI